MGTLASKSDLLRMRRADILGRLAEARSDWAKAIFSDMLEELDSLIVRPVIRRAKLRTRIVD